ncbi:AAA ATPase-like protein [Allonocardiopsis opalescens]|uniref:AAA ATPase-like protein n=1 Tax=Allonocardiopsis opalescens TaxID=1144618 RepID=A0A2T0PYQ3_9ACTN|nr:AAA ATPase-like protein [Allonocardiopsis opalescens]
MLSGEAGIGKSALLRHAAELALQGEPMRPLSCAGIESDVKQAFGALHQLLGPVLGHLDALPAAQAAALRGALGITDSTASDLLVSAAVLGLLTEAAADRPLLVAVDDLQWVDRASAAALLFAARRLAADPIAVLIAVRDSEPATVDIGDLPHLALGGLSELDTARLLSPLGRQLSSRWLRSVHAATHGNPLALIELARLGDPDAVSADLALTGTVPAGARVRAAFLRRVRTLPSDSRELLVVAAAEETGHTATVLGAANRLGLSADALTPAEEASLIEVAGPRLRFQHPLVRSAVYADAPFQRRRAAHLAFAAHLADQDEHDRATWHRALVATEADEELAGALERSADAARRRGGEAAAASVLQRAARLSETTEGRLRRTVAAAFVALDSGQPELARRLVDEIMAEPVPTATMARLTGTIELYSGDPAVAYEHLSRCAELLAEADPEEAAWLYMLASGAALNAGELAAAKRAPRRIAELDCSAATRRAGRGMARALEGSLSGTELWQLPEALARSQPEGGGRPWMWATVIAWAGPDQHQARRLAEATGQRLRAAGSAAPLTELLYYQADIEYRLGRWAEGIAHAEEGLRFAHETGQRGWMTNLLALLARFAAVRGEGAACRRYADRALAIAVPLRHRLAEVTTNTALGLLALAEGDVEDAYARLSELYAPGSPHGRGYAATGTAPELVEAAVQVGRADTAAAVVAAFEEWTGADGATPWARIQLEQCRALLAADGTAEGHYQRALAGAGVGELPFARARIALRYGEWLRRARRYTEARTRLRTATQLFDTLGAEPWARRARSGLTAAGGAAPYPGSAAELLTPQERAVARLAADGYSNREIGERLFLSPRTVGSHLYRMFPKLGISARAQLRDLDLG